MNESEQTQSEAKDGAAVSSTPLLGVSRVDFFAAAALQGLLASGQYTEENDEGNGELWCKLVCEKVYDDQGNDTGKTRNVCPAIELAWRMAEWMVRDTPNDKLCHGGQ